MVLRSEARCGAPLVSTAHPLGDSPAGPLAVQRLTTEVITKEARPGTSTTHRWSPTTSAGAIDSFVDHQITAAPIVESPPIRATSNKHAASLVDPYAGPVARHLAAIIAECQSDPVTLDEFQARFRHRRALAVNRLVERGVREDGHRDDTTPSLAAELIHSPIHQRLLVKTDSTDPGFAYQLVALAIDGLALAPC